MEGHKPHAGWYLDPHGQPGMKRYWDGEQWTDQYREVPDSSPPEPSLQAPERRYASLRTIAGIYQVLAWVIAGIGGIGVIVSATSTDNGGLVLIVGAIYVFFIVLSMLAFARSSGSCCRWRRARGQRHGPSSRCGMPRCRERYARRSAIWRATREAIAMMVIIGLTPIELGRRLPSAT